ncbi:MAG: thiamine pyrophosphate-dependent enzyme [Planctomycetota bacterium]
MPCSGIHALLDLLAGCGVRYLFGNPGTTELPLSDAMLAEERIRYILGLQEIPVMAIADGYAQASQQLGVVNVHISCGLGNAMGMLYNAFRSHTPLLVTAGQQDRRLMFEEPILWGQMVEVARPWTKWACEVARVEDLPTAVRRAVQAALTPPCGPVFLSIPLDVQMEIAELDLTPPQLPNAEVRPPEAALLRAAEVLAGSKNPVIVVGNRVCEAGAIDELVTLAEALGAPVFHEPMTTHGRISFPPAHPLSAGALPLWSPQIRERLAEFDALLAVGVKLLQLYIYREPARAIPESLRLVQIDESAWEIGKNYPVEVGLVGHPWPAMRELTELLRRQMTAEQSRAAMLRGAARGRMQQSDRGLLQREAREQLATRPMTPLAAMEAVARVLPAEAAVVEESPTTTHAYLERTGTLCRPDGYFAQRGWALGWGLNCAIGVKLAWPERPVLGLIGDGSAMYGIQGLWTAARYNIPVAFVICNNREYRILKNCAKILELPAATADRFEGLDLTGPEIDFVGISQAMGVAAERVESPDALSESLRAAMSADSPRLIEVVVESPNSELRA